MRDNPYPEELRIQFQDRRFAPLTPKFLDYVGAEIVMIASSGDVAAELGIELEPGRERTSTAELLCDLALDRREHPIAPLLDGDWI